MGLEEAVRFPGAVSDEVYIGLLQGCRALIFPSLYEGFGSPVLEALALGKPVLCSQATSLPEVAGDAAIYFDPRKPAEIVRAIEQIDSDADLAAHLMVHDFYYPPYMLQGIYADGWTGSRAVIAYKASPERRHLELVVALPSGTPYPCVSVDVRHHGRASPVPYILIGGQEEFIRLELSRQESSLELLVVPAFQPGAHGMGEDMRMLGCLCQACRIISAHGTQDLLAGRG
jgi:hypothetical protein